MYLGTAIGEVQLNTTDSSVLTANITQLFYFLKQQPDNVLQYSTAFSYAVEHFLLDDYQSNLLHVSFAHYQSLQDGLEDNAERFVPNFIASFAALAIFCITCSLMFRRRWRIDWIRSKPYVACAGLVNTLLAIGSSFGMMMLIGVNSCKYFNVYRNH